MTHQKINIQLQNQRNNPTITITDNNNPTTTITDKNNNPTTMTTTIIQQQQ
jgi:hypothetical protein